MVSEERKIQELPETSSISLTDQMIVETEDGTKLTDIATLKKLMNANFIVENVEQLKSASFKEGEVCVTLGYRKANDGGGAIYKIVYEPTLVDDGANVHYLQTSDTNRAKFIAINDSVTPEQFGAYGDGAHDDTAAIIKCINSGYKVIFKPGAVYCISTGITLRDNLVVDLNGATLKSIRGYVFRAADLNLSFTNVKICNGVIDCNNSTAAIYFSSKIENLDISNLAFVNVGTIGIRLANVANANIKDCSFKTESELSTTGIYVYANTDESPILSHVSVSIDNCTFDSIKRPVHFNRFPAIGHGALYEVYNCKATAVGKDEFVRIDGPCKVTIKGNMSIGYKNHVFVNNGYAVALYLTIDSAKCAGANHLLDMTGPSNAVNKIFVTGSFIFRKGSDVELDPSDSGVYGTIIGELYPDNPLYGIHINDFRELSKDPGGSKYVNAVLKDKSYPGSGDTVSIVDDGSESIDLAAYGSMSNMTIDLARSGPAITSIANGIVGQIIKLVSTGNRTITPDGVNLLLGDTITLSKYKGVTLKKIANNKWIQID